MYFIETYSATIGQKAILVVLIHLTYFISVRITGDK